MANITEKIERQITALEGKIDALSGNYLTNTWKRQREQQERDRKKEMYHSQIQVLQFLKQKSETDTLTLLEQNLTVAAFYEDMRCFSASKKYCKDNPYCKFQYPKPDNVRTKRLQKAGITDTDELAAAVECFDTLLQSAVIPPDPNAIRLRDMLYRAKMYQKGDIQFTPPELAKELVALAGVRKDSRVLEPEAGIGNIADAAKEVTDHVDCIERMTDFCEILKLKKHNVIGNDLLTAETAPIYDAVVMNPPFSEECEHIKRAFDFLRPGGSLVAVCSSSIQWKSTRKYEQFRDWLSEHTHSIDECGAKFEMTGVHTVVLVVDKAA
jgi:protein-L-isoaspartate O-methyltransferase